MSAEFIRVMIYYL